jgi:hypothetical protein
MLLEITLDKDKWMTKQSYYEPLVGGRLLSAGPGPAAVGRSTVYTRHEARPAEAWGRPSTCTALYS